jgi:hypothetical protein
MCVLRRRNTEKEKQQDVGRTKRAERARLMWIDEQGKRENTAGGAPPSSRKHLHAASDLLDLA